VLARLLPETVARHVPGLTATTQDGVVVLSDADGRARLTLVTADALDVTTLPGDQPIAFVANLPYNVSVPVLLTFLERFATIERGLVMVQAEVADRLAAPPGSRTYGVPSAKTAWYAAARRTSTIGRSVFWPVPNVDSALVRFDRREPPETTATRAEVFTVVDAAFAQRRKMLRSALASLFGSAAAAVTALEAAGVDPQARGERVDIVGFARIAEHLADASGRVDA
jgi:16S rRNA (adenine1518-N6/adenine1519-N6)-dimethyltransferase